MFVRFRMPTKLFIGENSVRQGSADLSALGRSCLVVTGRNSAKACGALDDAYAALDAAGVTHTLFDEVTQNPYLSTCLKAADIARESGVDFILGIGGGSPLDASKAIAVLAANPSLDGPGLYAGGWKNSALPVALIGTTSGTGSEVTQYAVITDDLISGNKKSIGAPQCFATLAFGDARYTNSLSYHFTVSTALDAMAHAVEGYFNNLASPLTDMFALPAIRDVVHALIAIRDKATENITPAQREALYLASIYAGMVIAQNRTGYCHALGYFLTEQHEVSHGMACAVFLPGFIRRSAALEPTRAKQLADAVDMDCETLCKTIESFTEAPKVVLAKEAIDEMAHRFEGSANYKATYGGFDAKEAIKVLTELFGA